jgi:hypothetical protein
MNIKREIKLMEATYDILGLSIDEFRLIKQGLQLFRYRDDVNRCTSCQETLDAQKILEKIKELDKKDNIFV